MSIVVICGSHIFEFSVSKYVKSMLEMKGGGIWKGSGKSMSNTNCQEIDIKC